MAPKRLKATAYHEAGHAYVAWRLGFYVQRATVIPQDDVTGSVERENPLRGIDLSIDGSARVAVRAEKAIMISLAGPEAERRSNPKGYRRSHCTADHDCAADLALSLCCDGEIATAYLRYLGLRTRAMIERGWPRIGALADVLLEHRALSGLQIRDALLKPPSPAS